jgi:hypothetical protein
MLRAKLFFELSSVCANVSLFRVCYLVSYISVKSNDVNAELALQFDTIQDTTISCRIVAFEAISNSYIHSPTSPYLQWGICTVVRAVINSCLYVSMSLPHPTSSLLGCPRKHRGFLFSSHSGTH